LPGVPEKLKSNPGRVLFFLLFPAIGLLIYSNTFHSPFILDDAHQIYENPYIRMTDFSWRIFSDVMKGPSASRPLAHFSFAINYYLHRYNLPGYHLVNLIIHLMTGILLFLFFRATLRVCAQNHIVAMDKNNRLFSIAFFAAMLWMIHPVNTQSVTYVVQRMNSMAAMFYILSLWLYTKARLYQQRRAGADTPLSKKKRVVGMYFAGCAVSGVCALASKQNAAVLPLFIVLYEWFFFQDLRNPFSRKRMLWVLCGLVVFAVIALMYLGGDPADRILSGYDRRDFNLPQRLMTELRIVIYYISLLLLPRPGRLNLDYDYPLSDSLTSPATTLICLVSILSLILFAFRAAKPHRLVSFGILWFFGNLLVESSIIPLAPIFEHRTYLPYMVPALAAVYFVFTRFKKKGRAVILLSLTATLFLFWTYQRNDTWRSKVSLWQDCVLKSPEKARPYSGLGAALAEEGGFEAAVMNFKKAIRLEPDFLQAHLNLGYALFQQERYSEAEECFRNVMKFNPNSSLTHFRLADALRAQGKTDEAVEHYSRAVELNPNDLYAHHFLGIALYEAGRLEEAIASFRNALDLKKDDPEAYLGLGDVYMAQGDPAQAIAYYLKAVKIKPDSAEACGNLGKALFKLGRIDQAAVYLARVLAINPDQVDAHLDLGMIMAMQGRFGEAEHHFRAALKLSPGNSTAHNNMGALLAQQHRDKEAMAHFQRALAINPNYSDARNNLEKLMHRSKNRAQ